jgi:hypothetical protein
LRGGGFDEQWDSCKYGNHRGCGEDGFLHMGVLRLRPPNSKWNNLELVPRQRDQHRAPAPAGTRARKAKAHGDPDLKLRRTWHDGGQPREDYEVIDARGERVGRMYRTLAVGGGEGWNWTVCTASR